LITVSLVVVTSVKIIGIILVTALLLTPGIIAKMWATTLNQMIGLSCVIGFFGALFGVFVSYFMNIPPGPSIVVILFCFFIVSMILAKLKKTA